MATVKNNHRKTCKTRILSNIHHTTYQHTPKKEYREGCRGLTSPSTNPVLYAYCVDLGWSLLQQSGSSTSSFVLFLSRPLGNSSSSQFPTDLLHGLSRGHSYTGALRHARHTIQLNGSCKSARQRYSPQLGLRIYRNNPNLLQFSKNMISAPYLKDA